MPRKILVVDDSETVRSELRHALHSAGFDVVLAEDGVAALALYPTLGEVSLLICDVNMPKMGGIEFVQELSQRSLARPPVIMLTTETNPELVTRAKNLGVRAWLPKPFDSALLVVMVKKIIAG